MSTSEHDKSRHQSFYGAGSFGGDNKGTINNNLLLDPQTKAYLADMAVKAPELATLLRRSLNEGFISPDTAQVLMLAAQNINEDVAMSLRMAGENINEDVAASLRMAGENINQEVANKLWDVNQELIDRVRELDGAARSLQNVMAGPDIYGGENNAVTYAPRPVISPSPSSKDTWLLRLALTSCSLGLGLVAAVISAGHHHGDAAMFAGVVALAIPMLVWINKALAKAGSRGSS
jgi:hypothetical protein